MAYTRKVLTMFTGAGVAYALYLVFPLATGLWGQEQAQPNRFAYAADPGNIPDAVRRVKSGDFSLVHVKMIAQGGAVEAIPALEQEFDKAQDSLTKITLASALVKLGNKRNEYWEYLFRQAEISVDNAGPLPVTVGAAGKGQPGPPPSNFVAWAKTQHLSLEAASNEEMFNQPARVSSLAESGDPRSIPLLRQALTSQNPFIQVDAALGLSDLHDMGSIPLIVSACHQASPDVARLLAESLVFFDDPQAQAAVDKYLPKDQAANLREAKKRGSRPFDRK